jgi:nucleotide-binding universal stress UspA family protein
VLVRVVEPTVLQSLAGTGFCMVDVAAARLKDADEYLAAVAANMREHAVRVTTEARHGEPVTELVAAARETRAGLIAMTTHGRSGLAGSCSARSRKGCCDRPRSLCS